MNFFSLAFIAEVAVALLVYYLMPQRYRWCVLLGANVAFYLAGGWRAGLFLLFTVGTNYVGGRLLSSLNELKATLTPEQKKEKDQWIKTRKKLVLILDLLLNFGLLFGVKYWNFTAQAIGNASG
jgi:hypothetical protein